MWRTFKDAVGLVYYRSLSPKMQKSVSIMELRKQNALLEMQIKELAKKK
jgi:hypothetical protein